MVKNWDIRKRTRAKNNPASFKDVKKTYESLLKIYSQKFSCSKGVIASAISDSLRTDKFHILEEISKKKSVLTSRETLKEFFMDKYSSWQMRSGIPNEEVYTKKHSEITDQEWDHTLDLIRGTINHGRLKDQIIIDMISVSEKKDELTTPPTKIQKSNQYTTLHEHNSESSISEEQEEEKEDLSPKRKKPKEIKKGPVKPVFQIPNQGKKVKAKKNKKG